MERLRHWIGVQLIALGMYIYGGHWRYRTYKNGVELNRGEV